MLFWKCFKIIIMLICDGSLKSVLRVDLHLCFIVPVGRNIVDLFIGR